jgi:hypothetical protein
MTPHLLISQRKNQMSDNCCNSHSPQPQVIVKQKQGNSEALTKAMEVMKQTIDEQGFFDIPSYLCWRDKHCLTDEQVLPYLLETGYGFVKTSVVNADVPQQVIVDLRYIAAAMLLIYSDTKFALRHSVLECVKTIYHRGNWSGAVGMSDILISDIYSTYGHHFTDMVIADAADLSEEAYKAYSNPVTMHAGHAAIVARNLPALNTLTQSEEELTAVFRLCVDVMHIVNISNTAGKMCRTYRDDGKAYDYFWRMACKIRDNARGRLKQTAHKCDENCNHH